MPNDTLLKGAGASNSNSNTLANNSSEHFHFELEASSPASAKLILKGQWRLGQSPAGTDLCNSLKEEIKSLPEEMKDLLVAADQLQGWDSSLAAALLQLKKLCDTEQIALDLSQTPEGLQQLFQLATTIPSAQVSLASQTTTLDIASKAIQWFEQQLAVSAATLIFIGDTCIALGRWLRGNAKTRRTDIAYFIEQAGPRALAIVTLISLLVGMILAYLGSVQLRQLGAQVYVADLVALGMVREMGALMTAVIMAGRTGAAYAAQLGTMQVNDEIDALRTMGISPQEFLVLPRLLALVLVIPLLCIYADIIGMLGGALVATSMDVNFTQYLLQTRDAVDGVDFITGIIKSIFFGVLIAVAGCQAGLRCGRNSDAVGMAATNAVVRAIVYLVVADAAFNILYDKLGI